MKPRPPGHGFRRSAALLLLLSLTATISFGGSGIEEILRSEHRFSFTDGSSVYSFFEDGRFLLEPVGLSGRAVEGEWTSTEEGSFEITGLWTWYNGISAIDDFRRMTIHVTLLSEEPNFLESLWQGTDTPVYDVYFIIDELTPLEATPGQ
jgi:hypothetical protein